MIHLQFHHKMLLTLLHITLLNKVHSIQITLIHSKFNLWFNFKQPLQQDKQCYNLKRTLQHKKHKHKTYNLVKPIIHYIILLHLNIFLDLHYKPFQLTHCLIALLVQIPTVHNTLQQVRIK